MFLKIHKRHSDHLKDLEGEIDNFRIGKFVCGRYVTKKNKRGRVWREIVASIPVTNFLEPQPYLLAVYQKAKASFPSYSYLKFAVDLGFAQSNVIRLVIANERSLTPKTGRRIGKALGLRGAHYRYWIKLVTYSYERVPNVRETLLRELVSLKSVTKPRELSATEASYFDKWYHPVIREMAGLPNFCGDPVWIQQRLTFPLRLDEIRRSLEVLESLNLIRLDKTSNRYLKTEQIQTGSDVDSMALVLFHQNMIDAGKESITRVDESLREIQSLTISVPVSAVEQLKAKMALLVQEVLALENSHVESSDPSVPTEVFQLNMQLFPFTHKKE